jgi:hypothetical protein
MPRCGRHRSRAGVVDANVVSRCLTRSQKVIRERLMPMARDLKVIIAVEEVEQFPESNRVCEIYR